MLTFDEYVKLAASYADYVASQPEPKPEPKPEWVNDIMKKLDSIQIPKPNLDSKTPITTVEDVVSKILNGRD